MKAVILYGAPGSGKGTQANLLADKLNLIHYDAGKHLETMLNDPRRQTDPEIQREKKLFDSGELLTPGFVLRIAREKIKTIAAAQMGIVLSGNPRTLFDAFGDSQETGLMAELENYYGKANIFIFYLKVSAAVSIARNSRRLICSVCGRPVLPADDYQPRHCGFCGGELRKRTIDNPVIIKERLKEFEEKTLPLLTAFKENGYQVMEINGEQPPYQVLNDIQKIFRQ